MRNLTCFFFLLTIHVCVYAQRVAINTNGNPADSSAILDITSTSKGVLIPRMTQAERDIIDGPAIGLLIYQTDGDVGFYVYMGTSWSNLSQRENVWGIEGNSDTNPGTQFIGTVDSVPLCFRVNNTWAGRLDISNENAFIGLHAGSANTTGNRNTGFGVNALMTNTIGNQNVALGRAALSSNTIGFKNTANGAGALLNNTSGYQNTATGNEAMYSNLTGLNNTANGNRALYSNSGGHDNSAFGLSSLYYNTTGNQNTATGANSLLSNSNGNQNTANGNDALRFNTGSWNTAIGANAMILNTFGANNTAIGKNALYFNTSGYSNTASGVNALYSNHQGYFNTANGLGSLSDNINGSSNTACGYYAMPHNENGGSNTAIGTNTMLGSISGSFNTAIGYASGTSGSFDNTISVGNNGYANAYHNQAFIGNLSTMWNGGNMGWSTYSDARVKKDVKEDVQGLDFITRLRPVTYHRDIRRQVALTGNNETEFFEGKYAIEDIVFSGFLAQEVEQAAIASGYDFSGITKPRNEKELYTLSYEAFVVPLVKAVKEQQISIETQNQKITSLEERIANLENLIRNLQE